MMEEYTTQENAELAERTARIQQAVAGLNERRGRIGFAQVSGEVTTADYGVYQQDGSRLYVEYEGYRRGSQQFGLSGRDQPLRFWTDAEDFDAVVMFGKDA
jgi:hypothetical protein